MKKILGILFAASNLLACNVHSGHQNDAAGSTNEQHEHAEEAKPLVLNNGVKWQADSTTLVNAANLQTIIAAAKKESLADYQQTAAALQEGLNKMVAECKMQGADHDALHIWLEPLMEKTKALGKATSAEKSASILHELETQVNLFSQYFQK